MATQYGSDQAYENARDDVVTEMTAMIAQMVTDGDSPRPAAVYAGHTSTVPMLMPCVTVGLETGIHSLPAHSANDGGPATRTLIGITIRVLIGYTPITYADDEKIGRLIQSVLNWMNENRVMTSGSRAYHEFNSELPVEFDDTETLGGKITFLVMTHQSFTAS